MKIRVMSYNIRLGIQAGVSAIAEVIKSFDPDLVALQEVGRHWVMGPSGDTTEALSALCGLEYSVYAPCIQELSAHYGHALLSRWPIEAPTLIPLMQRIDEPRAILRTRLMTPAAEIEVLSTHLSHIDDREAHGSELAGLAARITKPSLVLGDLNQSEPCEWLDRLLATYDDAFEHPLPTFPAEAPEVRIDYLLGRGGTWSNAEVIDEGHASDHRAIGAVFELG